MKYLVKVEGMSCQHCVQSVTKALSALPGAQGVNVDLKSGEARFEADSALSQDAIKAAVEDIGFDVASVSQA